MATNWILVINRGTMNGIPEGSGGSPGYPNGDSIGAGHGCYAGRGSGSGFAYEGDVRGGAWMIGGGGLGRSYRPGDLFPRGDNE